MTIKLYDLTDISSPGETFTEIVNTLNLVDPGFDSSKLAMIFRDIIRLFNGKFPGYRASNTKYHNLEHTCSVALATARLTHGLHLQGKSLPARIIELGQISAMFHDSGLIQTDDELQGTGAQYTIDHEKRSIALMAEYLETQNFNKDDIEDCGHMIMCTILTMPVAEIPFRSDDCRLMGMVLGSADLIAQMAARNYLEKLPQLFLEFKEAKMPGFETPLELFKHTEEFYHSVARTRLAEQMGNVAPAARLHFKERWNIDCDLYSESIRKNIDYIKKVYEDCADNFDCIEKKLRRKV